MSPFPTLVRGASPNGEDRYFLGDSLVDRYLEFVAGRVRANTLRAVAFDLKTFFTVVTQDPVEVRPTDVLGFVKAQRGARAPRILHRRFGGELSHLVRCSRPAGL